MPPATTRWPTSTRRRACLGWRCAARPPTSWWSRRMRRHWRRRSRPTARPSTSRRSKRWRARGRYGFIEALDYSPSRRAGTDLFTPVGTFMAHHQGMSIVALANVLLGGPAQRWGMANAHVQAVASLLHERAPREVSMLYAPPSGPPPQALQRRAPGLLREVLPGSTALEATHVLSNGRYSVTLRANGAGWSRWGRAGPHALARRCLARRPRQLLLPALGPAASAGLDHPSPRARPGRELPEHLPRRPRVLRRGLARGAGPPHGVGQSGGRHRVPAGRTAQPERSHARHRADVGLRGDAGGPACRRSAPRVHESLRARRVAGRAAGAGVRAQAPPAHRTGLAGRAFPGRHRPAGGGRAPPDRPPALAGPQPRCQPAAGRFRLLGGGRSDATAQDTGSRPGLRAVGAPSHRAQRKGPADLRHRGVRQRRHLARRDRQVPATQPRSTRLADVGHADRHTPAHNGHQPGELRRRPDTDHGARATA